jgi:acyl-CoA thioesterase FadM
MDAVWENRVLLAETDAQGIVFYGNDVEYQDETPSTFVADLGFDRDDPDRDCDSRAVDVELDDDSAAFRDRLVHDRLVHDRRVDTVRDSSLTFAYRCRRAADGACLVERSVTRVMVGEDGRSIRIPERFREAVREYRHVPPDPA